MARTPLRDGWRVLMRAPLVVLAEIAWRWTFGVALWATLYYSFREYFATVEISPAEYNLMRSLEPMTWMAITARVMIAVVTGLRAIGPIIIPTLAILWIALATIGRVATIRALADAEPKTNWVSTTALHAFRMALAFAAFFAFFGSGILINTLIGDPSQHFASTFLLSTIALIVIALVWTVVNWFISLAAIFTARDGNGFFRSITEGFQLYQARSNLFSSSGLSFGVLRTLLLIAATILSLIPIAQIGMARVRLTIVLVAFVSLCYFAIADWLNMWRLASYISFSEPEPEPPVVVAPPPPVEPASEPVSPPTVDANSETVPPLPIDESDSNNQ